MWTALRTYWDTILKTSKILARQIFFFQFEKKSIKKSYKNDLEPISVCYSEIIYQKDTELIDLIKKRHIKLNFKLRSKLISTIDISNERL